MARIPPVSTDLFLQPPPLHLLRQEGIRPDTIVALTGDASTRSFYRVFPPRGASLVAMIYPPRAEVQVTHHARVFLWAARHCLPVPRLRAWSRRVLLVEDLGSTSVALYLAANQVEAEEAVLATLLSFQRVTASPPNPPFDAALLARELRQFLDHSSLPGLAREEAEAFCDGLAIAIASHPFRLCHRDFHLDNLLVVNQKVMAVDFQDLRQGPDTYDLVSLLRERWGSTLFSREFPNRAARRLALATNWEARFWECAAQRGLKALGTFLKLAQTGRRRYLRLVPEVASNTLQALETLGAPQALRDCVANLASISGTEAEPGG